METITDNDLKMFQERARTEFASRCDTGGIAWDSVIWDLCNEVRRLRSVSKEHGDCAKLREALETLRELLGDLLRLGDAEYHDDFSNFCDIIDAALAAPPRNCDVGTLEEQSKRKIEFCYNQAGCFNCPFSKSATLTLCALAWAQMPYEEKEGGAK